MPLIRTAGACLNQTPLNWDHNVQNIINCIEEARVKKVEVLCLPELCITGYGCEDLFLSKWLPEKALSYLPEIAEACEDIMVAVGLPMFYDGLLYNCVCMIQDKQILGFNAKRHLADDGVHYEPRWFTSWDKDDIKTITFQEKTYPFGDNIYQYKDFIIGFEICEDAWRGDLRPACRLIKQGVNCILNPSASHFAMTKSSRRVQLVLDSSTDFDCTYVYANLLGNESGRMIFDGEIFIFQKGKKLAVNNRLSFNDFDLRFADIDPHNPENSVVDLVEDPHDKPTEFVKAASLALFDYLRKSFSKGFVLSLSGGADSTTCAILVSEMVRRGLTQLGTEKFCHKIHFKPSDFGLDGKETEIEATSKIICKTLLKCAYQATRNSGEATFMSAKHLAHDIGATFYSWSVDEEVTSYTQKMEKALGYDLTWEKHDITLQNIQARSRAPIIWMLANINNALLLTTSNRSEGDVGYATMDGDTCGSISPIAAVDKHFINQWLLWAEKELGYSSLKYVNSLNPTAELRPPDQHQTDETDLMPYHILVEIEILAIQHHQSPTQVFENIQQKKLTDPKTMKKYITKFFRLWSRNQWKRERIAPSFHLDDFNVDPRTWCRFPILSGGFKNELKELEEL